MLCKRITQTRWPAHSKVLHGAFISNLAHMSFWQVTMVTKAEEKSQTLLYRENQVSLTVFHIKDVGKCITVA